MSYVAKWMEKKKECGHQESQRTSGEEIMLMADMIHGEINRICVTNNLAEYGNMCMYAKKHLDELIDMVYEAREWKE